MTLSKSKLEILLTAALLIFVIKNIDGFVININFAYYAILLGIILFVAGKINVLIILFLVFYPCKFIIPFAHNELVGIINIDDILLLSIAILFLLKQSKKLVSYKVLDRNSKMAIYFTLFALLVVLAGYTREIVICGISELGYFLVIKRIGKAFLLTSVIIMIIMQSKDLTTRKMIDNAIIIGVILMGMACIFWKPLQSAGLNISAQISRHHGVTMERVSAVGFDPNQFAALMLLCFGYFLSRIEVTHSKKSKYFIGCVFSVVAIAITGSRGGLVVFVIISAIFVTRNYKNPKYLISAFLIVVLCFTTNIISNITAVKRMDTLGIHLDRSSYGRMHRQIIATRYLFNNPSALIIGSNKPFVYVLGRTRHLHNYYISILFRFGAVVLIIYMILIYKLFKLENIRGKEYSLIYPLLGFFLPKLGVVYGLFIYFPLIVAMSSKDPLIPKL